MPEAQNMRTVTAELVNIKLRQILLRTRRLQMKRIEEISTKFIESLSVIIFSNISATMSNMPSKQCDSTKHNEIYQ